MEDDEANVESNSIVVGVSVQVPKRSGASGKMNRLDQVAYLARNVLAPRIRERARHDYFDVFLRSRNDMSRELGTEYRDASILVLGCGYTYPDVVLWSSIAKRAVGVDVATNFYRNGWLRLYRGCRAEDKSPVRSLVEASYRRRGIWSYYRYLRTYSGVKFDYSCQDIVSYQGNRLPFKNGSFDIVCSNAVLEHVADLDSLCAEISRVTSESGISYHLWHNYYSLSGAHVPTYISHAHPWGHLLKDPDVVRHLKFSGTFLNKKLPEEILQSLKNHFAQTAFYQVDVNHRKKGVDSDFSYEGQSFLGPDLESRLGGYPRETLLTRAYMFIGRRAN